MHQEMKKEQAEKQDKRVQHLCKEHDQLRQLLVRFIRFQFEYLHIGLVMSVLLQKLLKK